MNVATAVSQALSRWNPGLYKPFNRTRSRSIRLTVWTHEIKTWKKQYGKCSQANPRPHKEAKLARQVCLEDPHKNSSSSWLLPWQLWRKALRSQASGTTPAVCQLPLAGSSLHIVLIVFCVNRHLKPRNKKNRSHLLLVLIWSPKFPSWHGIQMLL